MHGPSSIPAVNDQTQLLALAAAAKQLPADGSADNLPDVKALQQAKATVRAGETFSAYA